MKKNKFMEYTANAMILIMLCIISLAAFSGTFYGAVVEKEAYAPIYRGATAEKKISLMINVYWGSEYVIPMANVFKAYGYTTTFFIGGSWAAKNVDIVKELYDSGFELGNHGYNHKNHGSLSYDDNKKEILITDNLIKKITGECPAKLFAPPSGDMGKAMHTVCDENGFKVIMWTRDTIDWRDKDSRLTYSRAIKNLAAGDLILMHPTAHTLEALPSILDYIRTEGYSVVPVGEIIP